MSEQANAGDMNAFAQDLAESTPSLRGLWRAHLEDNFNMPLPHLFMDDVARWFLQQVNSGSPGPDVARLTSRLEQGLINGASDVKELIQTSFVENLPTGQSDPSFLRFVGPALAADYARFTGQPR
jgi:hypothetical protein